MLASIHRRLKFLGRVHNLHDESYSNPSKTPLTNAPKPVISLRRRLMTFGQIKSHCMNHPLSLSASLAHNHHAVVAAHQDYIHHPCHRCLPISIHTGGFQDQNHCLENVLSTIFLQRDTVTQEFYSRTVAALDAKQASDAEAANKLRTIKESVANTKANQRPIGDSGGSSSGKSATYDDDAVASSQKPLTPPKKGKDNEDKAHVDIEVHESDSTSSSPKGSHRNDEEETEEEVIEEYTSSRSAIDRKAGKVKASKDAFEMEDEDKADADKAEEPDGEKSVAGRKLMQKGGEAKDVQSGRQPSQGKKVIDENAKVEEKAPRKSKKELELEAEMNAILKRGPSEYTYPLAGAIPRCSVKQMSSFYGKTNTISVVIIFSKSTCPYSAKAKRILLDKYNIVPKPHVVELDHHRLGSGLQNALEKSTGRRTVPNILINGKSVGGGDDIESAEIAGTLVEKIKNMGGKRIMEVTQRRTGD